MNNLKLTIFVVFLLSVVSKVLGLIRDIIITNFLGFNAKTDALFIALSLVTLLFSTFNTTIRTTFAPLFSSRFKTKRENVLEEFNILKNSLIFILIILMIILFAFPEYFLKVFTPGLTGVTEYHAVTILRYLSFILVFYGFYYIYTGFLQAINIFKTVETAAIINNVTIIGSILLLYKRFGIYSVVVGYTIGSLFQAIYSSVIFRVRTKYKPKLSLKVNLRNKDFKDYIQLSKYVLFGSFVTQITVFSDKFVASYLDTGTITALHYANVVKNLPLNMVILVVTNILFTNLSIYFQKSKQKFNNSIIDQLKYLLFFVSPIIIILFTYSYEIIELLLYRGEFTLQGVTMTSQALVAYSIGLFFWVFKEVFTKASYAAKDTKTPLIITVSSLIINLILNFILGYFWGHIGIAAATSISLLFNSLFIFLILQKKNILENKGSIIKIFLRFVLMLVGTTLLIFYLKNMFLKELNLYLNLGIGIFNIILIYTACSKLLGIDILKLIRHRRRQGEDI